MFYIYNEVQDTKLSYSNGELAIVTRDCRAVVAKTTDKVIDEYLSSRFTEDKVLDKPLKREIIYIKGYKVVIDPETKLLTFVDKGESVSGKSQAVVISVVGEMGVSVAADDKNIISNDIMEFSEQNITVGEMFIRWANWSRFRNPVFVSLIKGDKLYKMFKLATVNRNDFNCNSLFIAGDEEIAHVNKMAERRNRPKTEIQIPTTYKGAATPVERKFNKGSKPVRKESDDIIDKFNRKYASDQNNNRSKKNGGKNKNQGKRR